MNQFLLLLVIIIVSIGLSNILSSVLSPQSSEGFTTYFRQTFRPQMRHVRYARDTVAHHINTKSMDFGRRLGLV